MRRLVNVAMTRASSHTEVTSLPPPEPTRNGPPGMTVELMFPCRSIWAAPRPARVFVPAPPTSIPRTDDESPIISAVGKLRWLKTNGSAGRGS